MILYKIITVRYKLIKLYFIVKKSNLLAHYMKKNLFLNL